MIFLFPRTLSGAMRRSHLFPRVEHPSVRTFRRRLKQAGACVLACVAAASAQITLNDGTALAFGDKLSDLQVRLNEKPFDIERGRPGVDQILALTTAELGFDTERLWRVTLKDGHLFPSPLAPFAEEWRDFAPISERKLGYRMTRTDFDAYLAAWQARAQAAGKVERTDYWIQPAGTVSDGERITLMFTPRRRLLGTGTLVGDAASFWFSGTVRERFDPKTPAGTLASVTFTCEAFRTARRETAESAKPPVPRRNGLPLAAEGVMSPPLLLDDGRTIRFGQALAEVEQTLGVASRDDASPIARKGRDRQIVTATASFEFDTGRLAKIRFNEAHGLEHPVRVFDEPWKNPDPIGELRLRRRLPRAEFQAYLDAWKQRATAAGKREGIDYRISVNPADEFSGEWIFVALAPDRLTSNGRGTWSDDWSVHFTTGNAATLSSLSLLLDAYNTHARPPPGARDPALTGVLLEDGTELYFGQAQTEVERLIGSTATSPSTRPGDPLLSKPRLSLAEVGLTFDAGRLAAIDYRRIIEPPAPFPEQWKNLVALGERRITMGMTRENFAEYLVAWQSRASGLGLVQGKQYTVSEQNFEQVQSVNIRLASSGISAGGRRVSDTWQFSFNPRGQAPNKRWVLVSLQATRGALSSSPPSPATQRKNEIKEMARELPKMDLPKVELPTPELVAPK